MSNRTFSDEHKSTLKKSAAARSRAQAKFNQLPILLLSLYPLSKEEIIEKLTDFITN